MIKRQKKEVRFLVDNELLTRFKVICVKLDLSVPKQMTALIKNFVEIQEQNIKNMSKS